MAPSIFESATFKMKEAKMHKGFTMLFIILLSFYTAACEPPPEVNINEYREENRFPQDFENTGAYLVLEWNGLKPYIMASGNLVNKEKGIFRTAKHFTDAFGELGVDYCKVFFNGKVYRATLLRVPPMRDAALIQLLPPFSAEEFPDPLVKARTEPKIGEKIYIQGFHPHAYRIRQLNLAEGFPDKELNIFETYYEQVIRDLSRESQVVFDNLEGTRVSPNPNAVKDNNFLSDEEKAASLEYENNRYIKVLMTRDHKFSFGGLSGGVALNDKGEAVGVITAQDILRFVYDGQGSFFLPNGGVVETTEITKQLWDTIYVTPINSIKDLDEYIYNFR